MTALDEPRAAPGAVPTPDETVSGGVRGILRELRPSVATGGLPALPLIILFLLNAADEFDRIAFAVLLPEIKNYFGVSLATIVTITSLASFFVILLAGPIGYLSDRLPRTKMLGFGAAIWGGFSVLTAFATSVGMLGVFRFGSGAAKSLDPAQQSLIADYYPPDRRAAVFAFHRLANSVGQFAGPLVAATLATVFFWQAPFLAFGIAGFAVSAFTLFKLREPPRGGFERLSIGLDPEDEATPPSLTESWRAAKAVRSLRRIWYALPFIAGALSGIVPLMALYYDEVFDVGVTGRGIISALNEPFQILGLLIGGAIGNRLLRDRPSRVITLVGLSTMAMSLGLLAVAFAPALWIAVATFGIVSLGGGITLPATTTLMTLVIPPRVRGFALAISALMIAPGFLFAPIAASFADRYGIRVGIAVMVPVFFVGALIIATGAATVDGDIRAATAGAAAARVSKDRAANALLVCRDVDVSYGQVQILFNVDLDIREGEIVALLGTNGAGKSTMLNAVAGVAPPSNGAIFFAGEDITYLPDHEHVEKGIVMVPGGRGIFPTLSVAENLRLATWGRTDRDAVAAAMEQTLGYFPVLRERADENAGDLSGGEQQMLTLGQAFLSTPRLLMIDELSLGLAPAVVEQLLEIVRAIHDQGTTIVLVEQSVNVALTIADRVIFMEKGEVRFTGPTTELLQRSDILRSVFLAGSQASLGGVTLPYGDRHIEEAAPILELRGIGKRFGGVRALANVDLTLREGEILGIIGPNGAGKTTVFDTISGFVEPDVGTVVLLGEDVTYKGPDERARMGLQRSFQDARLFPALTVAETIAVALDQRMDSRSALLAAVRAPNVANAERRTRKRVERLIDLIGLGPFRDKFLRELSTGTRRLVDLACVLGADPAVLLLDEPSSGVAQRETEELGPLLHRVKSETGCSILIIEHDMPLITSVADELVAMILGTPAVRGAPSEVLDDPLVVEAYLGTNDATIKRSGALSAS